MNQFLSFKNCQVHYTVVGRGSTVVLLHGFLENRSMWDTLTETLSAKYRVVCIDLLGHGETGNLGYVHRMEDQAELVKTVMAALRVRRVTVVGHSMGGYVGLSFAKLFPKMIKGLLLMNSTALPDTPEKKINRDRAMEAVKQNHKTFVRLAIPQLFAEQNRKQFTTEIELVTKQALMTSAQGIIAALEGMKIRKSAVGVLRKSDFPVGMIIGLLDPVLAFESLMDQIRNTNVISYELSGGHMSHLENEAHLSNAILDFLKQCR